MSGASTRGEGEEAGSRAATKNSFGNVEKCLSSIRLQSSVKRFNFKHRLILKSRSLPPPATPRQVQTHLFQSRPRELAVPPDCPPTSAPPNCSSNSIGSLQTGAQFAQQCLLSISLTLCERFQMGAVGAQGRLVPALNPRASAVQGWGAFSLCCDFSQSGRLSHFQKQGGGGGGKASAQWCPSPDKHG